MKRNDSLAEENLDSDKAMQDLEEKTKNRDRQKKKRMAVSGKSVFKEQELKKKRAEELPQDEE